jgi:hypothetical protein
MPIGWMVMSLLAMSPHAAAPDVTVCLTAEGTALTAGSKQTASEVLRKAGVTIAWQRPGPQASGVPRTWVRIQLVEGTSNERPAEVLAVSYPYARCSQDITVFLDRIRSVSHGFANESTLLAYVLAHEITHVIQGIDRHSQSGVMKARWTEKDRAAIFERRLGFEDVDVQLMRRGLAAGLCGGAPGLMVRSGSGIAFHPE